MHSLRTGDKIRLPDKSYGTYLGTCSDGSYLIQKRKRGPKVCMKRSGQTTDAPKKRAAPAKSSAPVCSCHSKPTAKPKKKTKGARKAKG